MTTSRTETTGSRTKGRTGARVAGLLGIVALLGVAMAWLLGSKGEETVSVAPTESVSPEQLRTAAGARIFLGHQSVGANLLDGVPAVYAAEGVPASPPVRMAIASGTRPRKGTPISAAAASTPPAPNGSLISPQCGQA